MDDFSQKLRSVLSDPESIRNLSELAAMLQDTDGTPEEDASPSGTPPEMPQTDFSKLLAAGQALSQVQDDKNAALILALKPHLSEARAQRADRAVRLLRLYAAAGILRESGMLQELL